MKLFDRKVFKVTTAIFFIAIVSFLICLPFTKPGYVFGHDNPFHFSQIKALYTEVKAGNGFAKITYSLYHGIGYGTRLFYASFSHTITVIIGLIIEPFGLTLLSAYKIVVFLSLFVSGIMVYFFVYRMSGNSYYGIISAILYVAFPYRIVDIYIRNAFAEVVAFTFLPGVFWGIYEILNQKKKGFLEASKGYILVILNFSLLMMTHNISSIYCAIFAGLIILFNINKVIKIVKMNPWNYLYVGLSIVLMFAIVSPLVISLLVQRGGLDYAVFKLDNMGAGIERLQQEVERSTAFMVSGFNFYEKNLIQILLCSVIALILYLILKGNIKWKYAPYIYNTVPLFILGVMPLITNWVVPNYFESWYHVSFFLGSMFIIFTVLDFKSQENYKQGNLLNLIGYIALCYICFFLMYNKAIWASIPSFLRNIQFPWRLWSFFSLFLALIIPLLMNYIKVKYSYKKMSLGVLSMFLVISLYPINKGEWLFPRNENETLSHSTDINNYPYNVFAGGWSREYFPEGFFGSTEGRSQLYKEIRRTLDYEVTKYNQDNQWAIADDKLNPIVFKAYSTNNSQLISDNEVSRAPKFSANFMISKDTTIQIPFLFYTGYQAIITNLSTNEKVIFTPYESDFLVTIDIKADTLTTFHVDIDFKGTTLMQISDVISPIAVTIVIAAPLVAIIINFIKKRKKEEIINSSSLNNIQ